MTMLSPAQAEDQLNHLAQQFAQWRQSRTTFRGRIPKPLWAQAVALSQVLPLARVAKRLGLTPQTLKRRAGGQTPTVPTPLPASPHFVEETAPSWRAPTAEAAVPQADSTRKRQTYREAKPAWDPLLQTFWVAR